MGKKTEFNRLRKLDGYKVAGWMEGRRNEWMIIRMDGLVELFKQDE